MTVADLIHEAESFGIELWAEGSALRYRGDSKAVQALLPTIRQLKPAILAVLAGKSPAEPEMEPANDLASAPPLPPPWDAIRGRIQAGWRAEFGPPGPDGRQAITWIPPGAWKSEDADQGEPEPNTAKPFRNSYENHAQPVRCCDCRHQEPTGHPALIRCGAGRQALGACGLWWNTDRRQCSQFGEAQP
jgi:hypothetical protein